MAKIAALTPDELHADGTEFTSSVLDAVTQVLRDVRGRLHGPITLDDLAVIPTLWRARVDEMLLPLVAEQYQRGVDTVHGGASQLIRDALTSAAPLPDGGPPVGTIDEALPVDTPLKPGPLTVTKVSNTVAEKYLAGASNRLVNVGNEVWESARNTLLEGFLSGEGITELASRLGMVPETYAARGEVIARTEVQSASNVGATDQIKAIDVPAEKTWMATLDERTRPEHADADGQTVPVDESYDVGGESLDCPGDPSGSAENVINCRCTQEFNIPDDQVGDMSTNPEGDMIDEAALEPLVSQAMDGGFTYDPITDGSPDGGYSVSPYPDRSVVVPTGDLTESAIRDFTQNNADLLSQPDHHLGAWRDTADGKDQVWLDVSIVHNEQAAAEQTAAQFDQKAIFDLNTGSVIDTGGTGGKAGLASGEVAALPDQAHEYRHGQVRRSRGSPQGAHERSASEASSGHSHRGVPEVAIGVAHGSSVASLTATIKGAQGDDHVMSGPLAQTVDLGGKPNQGTKPDRRIKENKNGKAADQPVSLAKAKDVPASAAPQWRGVLTVEGTPTGDHREFAPNSLTWVTDDDNAPMILQWQKESGHGSDHDVTVAVGRIDKVWRDGANIMGEGRFDTHPDAVEAHRRMSDSMLNGTSINADDISDADVEYVWPEGEAEEGEEDDLLMLLFAKPEKVIFHAGRIRATTLCDIPAFVEAKLSIVDGSTAPVSTALDTGHSTATEGGAWDGAAAEARLPEPMTEEIAYAAYASVEDGAEEDAILKTNARFLHHEIDEGGLPGAANLSACSSDIALLHDAEISDSAKRGIYNHLARHLRDGGQEVPPFETQHALVAHAWTDTFRPAATWFRDPQLTVPTPIMVTDQGRVYGLATEWSECHMGYMNECVLPPRDDDFSRFMTGEQPLDDGTIAAVGLITAGIGHAAMTVGANHAAEHYDNTDAIIAYVATGNCRLGIWVAGAIVPWAQEARVSALRASGQVSPDWRRVGGKMRMVGLLTVNISGYQVPRARTYVTASGQLQTLIASGFTSVRRPTESSAELDQRALRHLSDQIAKRVHPELEGV